MLVKPDNLAKAFYTAMRIYFEPPVHRIQLMPPSADLPDCGLKVDCGRLKFGRDPGAGAFPQVLKCDRGSIYAPPSVRRRSSLPSAATKGALIGVVILDLLDYGRVAIAWARHCLGFRQPGPL